MLGLHPWCLHTAASVIAERELWKFADSNPDIDVTSSTFFLFPLSLTFSQTACSSPWIHLRALRSWPGDRPAPFWHVRVGLRAAPRAARPVDDSQRATLLTELRARGGRSARTRCGAERWNTPAAAPQARAARRGIRVVARGRRAPLRSDARDPGTAPESGGRAGPAPSVVVCPVRNAQCA
jgi:hypothetical protein